MTLKIARVEGNSNKLSIKFGNYAHLRINRDLSMEEVGKLIEWAGWRVRVYALSQSTTTERYKYPTKELKKSLIK